MGLGPIGEKSHQVFVHGSVEIGLPECGPGTERQPRAGNVIAHRRIQPVFRTVDDRAKKVATIAVHMGEVWRQGQEPRRLLGQSSPGRKMKRRHIHLVGDIRIDTRRDQRLGVIERILPEDHSSEDALLLVAQRNPGQRPPFGHLPFGAARKNTRGLIERAGMTGGRKRPRKRQIPVEHMATA